MDGSSPALPLFENICREILARLADDPSESARSFAAQAHELLTALQGWALQVPTPAERAATISRVLELHRAVMERATAGTTIHPRK